MSSATVAPMANTKVQFVPRATSAAVLPGASASGRTTLSATTYLGHMKGQEVGVEPVVRRLLAGGAKGVRGFEGRAPEWPVDVQRVLEDLLTAQNGADILANLKGQMLRGATGNGIEVFKADDPGDNERSAG